MNRQDKYFYFVRKQAIGYLTYAIREENPNNV